MAKVHFLFGECSIILQNQQEINTLANLLFQATPKNEQEEILLIAFLSNLQRAMKPE